MCQALFKALAIHSDQMEHSFLSVFLHEEHFRKREQQVQRPRGWNRDTIIWRKLGHRGSWDLIRSLALIIPMKPLEGLMQRRAMLYLWLTCCGKHRQMFLRRVNKEACLPGQPAFVSKFRFISITKFGLWTSRHLKGKPYSIWENELFFPLLWGLRTESYIQDGGLVYREKEPQVSQ